MAGLFSFRPLHSQDWTGRIPEPILGPAEGPTMSQVSYNQFCPIAKACEVLEPRWTILILSEMWSGSTRFNEIRRGVPGMSPTLQSKRLKELEHAGLITRTENRATGDIIYKTTSTADELRPIVYALGQWAHRNIEAEVSLERLDARLLMWNMRRKIDTAVMPGTGRRVIQFIYPELPKDQQSYWLIVKPGMPVDLCSSDPGHDVDLFVTADLKGMTSAWMGWSSLSKEVALGKIVLIGDPEIAASIGKWMVRSSYAEDTDPAQSRNRTKTSTVPSLAIEA
ncbi:winged helix-turn-helix transcriptional regulator [Tabrizicola sp.]|uniref:winged helix-turn-helix transcriptional regulator n=1 Tax=Tabrizicola sp. TaxID=2005166 RepID=UPI003F3D2E11